MWKKVSLLSLDTGEYLTTEYEVIDSLTDTLDSLYDAIEGVIAELGMDVSVSKRLVNTALIIGDAAITLYDNETMSHYVLDIDLMDTGDVEMTIECY